MDGITMFEIFGGCAGAIAFAFCLGAAFCGGKLVMTEWYCKNRENRINKENR